MNSKVIKLPDTCTVRMDGQLHESRDFVTVIGRESGDASIFYNTDALTLGMAVKMIAVEYVKCIGNCTPEDQQAIESILGEAFILERMREVSEGNRG